MKRYLILLLFSLNAFAQTSQTFSSFVIPNLDSTKGNWVFDNTYHADIKDDISANLADFVSSGFSANFADELIAGSIIYSGGKYLAFGGSDYLAISDANADGILDPGTNDFAVMGWIKTGADVSAIQFIINKRQVGLGAGWYVRISTGALQAGLINASIDLRASKSGLLANTNYFFIAKWDRDGNISIDFNQSGSAGTASIAVSSGFNVNNSDAFAVGVVSALNGSFFSGGIYQLMYMNRLPTAKEVNDAYGLSSGWVSKNGNVSRESFAFAQTFWDTIGVPLSDATLGNNQVWQLSFKGKSSDATPTIRAWIGSAAVAKSSVYSITAGESFSTQAVNFGNAFALSSDTLWFASASTADTVSVDDVVLSKTYLSGKKINSWSKH